MIFLKINSKNKTADVPRANNSHGIMKNILKTSC